ncbi:hypothetical protein BJX76DRAFT_354497 [Aspergillus varians]
MSPTPPIPEIKVVDSLATLLELLASLKSIPTSSPLLFIDLEGINLGRNGSISILSLYAVHKATIYLGDVHTLGKSAFSSHRPGQTTSLKAILESPSVKKVILDARNDSDALFSHYSEKGIEEICFGLAKCIELASPISYPAKAEWKRRKENVTRRFDPRKGGRYDIFNERPLAPDIRDYCAADVALLPGLYSSYGGKMSPEWKVKGQKATDDRIRLSQKPEHDGQARDKVLGPWAEDDGSQGPLMFGESEDSYFLEEDSLFDAMFDQEEDDWDDDHRETARDCIGWEEDMIKNGSPF